MLPKLDERRSHKEATQNEDQRKDSRSPSGEGFILCTNGNLEQDGLESPCDDQGNEKPDPKVTRKEKAREKTNDAEKRIADE